MSRGFAVAAIVVVVAVVLSIGLSDQKLSEEQEPISLETVQSGPSCVWMEYTHRDRPLQYWIGIWETGEVWYLRFDNSNRIERNGIVYPRILESRSGRLAREEAEALLGFMEKKGFFDMESGWASTEQILSEDDIVTIAICQDETVHEVHARPPSHISKELEEIVRAIEEKTRGLQEDLREGVFLEAERLDESRADRLRETHPFHSLLEGELDERSHVKWVISNPGQFVHAGSWEDAGIEAYLGSNSFFFVSAAGGEFEIRVFLRQTTKR